MPVVTATLIEGYDEDTRTKLCENLTNAVRATIAAPPDGITIIINEVPAANYMRGGVGRTPGKPLPGPAETTAADTVRAFLDAMERRELETAKGFLADGFTMLFPGAARFSKLEELIAWAKPRYRFVSKTYQRFDTTPTPEGAAVYCHGMLQGEWPDGVAFKGIRFIDRFTVADGKLLDQQVWNDLAEYRG